MKSDLQVVNLIARNEGKLVRLKPPPPYDWDQQDPYLRRREEEK